MTPSAAAELKTMLVGVPLPAGRPRLLSYASSQDAQWVQLDALRQIAPREYISLDEVVNELLHVQPSRDREEPQRPHEESGDPPGGDDYTNERPSDTGQVRDLESVEG